MGRCVSERRRVDGGRPVFVDFLSGYLVNEYGRQALFELPAYGGANCAVRMSTLRALGGWNEETVTEDTDLTLRLLLSGQRVRYDVTPSTTRRPWSPPRFWTQRYRWARGHQQAWREFAAVCAAGGCPRWRRSRRRMFLLSFHLPVFALAGWGCC